MAEDRKEQAAPRALRFDRFGGPEMLRLVRMDAAEAVPLAAEEALVAVRAASINPSDVKNLAGRMRQTVPPRTPGRDFAGIVVRGPEAWLGAAVWGTGGDLGFTRDGSHAALLRLPVAALRRKPERLSFAQAAAVGVNHVTALLGLEAAGLCAGETLVVLGASGGVGGAACALGAARGARVLAGQRGAPEAGSPAARIAAECLDLGDPTRAAERVLAATDGRGAAVVFDCVGTPALFQAGLAMLGLGGRMVCIAGQPGEAVPLELISFYRRELRLIGVDSLRRSAVDCAKLMDALHPGFESGALAPPVLARCGGLEDAGEAYAMVARGSRGRVVLVP